MPSQPSTAGVSSHSVCVAPRTAAADHTWYLGVSLDLVARLPDQAVQVSDEKDAHARMLGHPFNLCHCAHRHGRRRSGWSGRDRGGQCSSMALGPMGSN